MPARKSSVALLARRNAQWQRQHRNVNGFPVVGLKMSFTRPDARSKALHIHWQENYIEIVSPSASVHAL